MQGWGKKGKVKKLVPEVKEDLSLLVSMDFCHRAFCWGSCCPRLLAYKADDDLLCVTQRRK